MRFQIVMAECFAFQNLIQLKGGNGKRRNAYFFQNLYLIQLSSLFSCSMFSFKQVAAQKVQEVRDITRIERIGKNYLFYVLIMKCV